MEEIKKLGNVELLKHLLALHYKIFNFFENEFKDDPRAYEYIEILNDLTKSVLNKITDTDYYLLLFKEAQNRGLKEELLSGRYPIKELVDSDSFIEWEETMKKTPTYLREIEATNFLGGYDISYVNDEVIGFDYPVRNACKILNEKGYITYWSSANKEDYMYRKGQVIKDKSVAYILIDPTILTDSLKKTLQLNGTCKFWGIAHNYNDEGKYYGIWSEIESLDVTCESISADLSKKALDLPILEKTENNSKKL